MLKSLLASKIAIFTSLLMCAYSCRDTKYAQGRILYEVKCQNCHLADFKGLGKNIPDLTNSFRNSFNSDLSVCIIHNGRINKDAMLHMPSFKELSDVEFHNLINYINEQLGGTQSYSLSDISKLRLKCTLD